MPYECKAKGIFFIVLLTLFAESINSNKRQQVRVKVAHLTAGSAVHKDGPVEYSCGSNYKCEWLISDRISALNSFVASSHHSELLSSHETATISLGLYNIDTLQQVHQDTRPLPCLLQTNLTMWETSDVCTTQNCREFLETAELFDGSSTVSSNSDVPKASGTTSWECHICHWAVRRYHHPTEFSAGPHFSNLPCVAGKTKLSAKFECSLVKAVSGPDIYYVKDGVLRWIPDYDTFRNLGFEHKPVKVFLPGRFKQAIVGPPLPHVPG